MSHAYTNSQMAELLSTLREVFDLVRVVDPVLMREALPSTDGTLPHDGADCFAVWQGQSERCQNCISVQALQQGKRQSKYEFNGKEAFYVIAQPVTVEGRPLALEILSKVNEHVLLGEYGADEFVERITSYNHSLHSDPSTGLFNRRYLYEKLFLLLSKANLNKTDVTLVLVDIVGLNRVARHYGVPLAEQAMSAAGRLLTANVSQRRGDFVCRFRADGFALVIDNIPGSLLRSRMITLCERINGLRLQGYEDVHLAACLGVVTLTEDRALTVEGMIESADRRLRAALSQGPNHIVFSD